MSDSYSMKMDDFTVTRVCPSRVNYPSSQLVNGNKQIPLVTNEIIDPNSISNFDYYLFFSSFKVAIELKMRKS